MAAVKALLDMEDEGRDVLDPPPVLLLTTLLELSFVGWPLRALLEWRLKVRSFRSLVQLGVCEWPGEVVILSGLMRPEDRNGSQLTKNSIRRKSIIEIRLHQIIDGQYVL